MSDASPSICGEAGGKFARRLASAPAYPVHLSSPCADSESAQLPWSLDPWWDHQADLDTRRRSGLKRMREVIPFTRMRQLGREHDVKEVILYLFSKHMLELIKGVHDLT